MAERVEIYVPKRAIIWLPLVKDPGNRWPALALRKGRNRVIAKYWGALDGHPTIRNLLRAGELVVGATDEVSALAMAKELDVEAPATRPSMRGLRDMTIDEAAGPISECEDEARLMGWRNSDERVGIKDLIDDRILEIRGDDDDGEDEDTEE